MSKRGNKIKTRSRACADLLEDNLLFGIACARGLTSSAPPASVSGLELLTFPEGAEDVDGLNQSPLLTILPRATLELI